MKILFWFRNNLRLQDNSVLNKALDDANEIAFIYIQNQTFDKDVQWGFPRVAAHRKYFQHQGLIELDHSLKKYGHRLNFFIGDPIDTLKKYTSIMILMLFMLKVFMPLKRKRKLMD